MAKAVKREVIKEEDDKTIYYMLIGFGVGALVSLLFFEYYWVGVGGGTGMLLGIILSAIVDYTKAKNTNVSAPASKTKKSKVSETPKKEVKKSTIKKAATKKTTKK